MVLIKDLPLKGAQVLKGGTKTKPIRLGVGDHEISCKIEGMSIGLEASRSTPNLDDGDVVIELLADLDGPDRGDNILGRG